MKVQIFLLSLFLCLFSFSSTTFASSSAGEVTKELILSKSQLEKQGKTGKNYIKAIDSFVEKNALDSGKLSEIQQKITTALPKLGNSQKDRVVKEVLYYLDYKIQYVSLKSPSVSSGSSSGGATQAIPKNQNERVLKEKIIGMSEEELIRYLEEGSIEELKTIANTLITQNEQTYILGIYNEQIKKARDSSRFSDLKMLQASIEQSYQDAYNYPSYEEFRKKVSIYAGRIPKDPLQGFSYNSCNFGYTYQLGTNPGELKNQRYKLSTCVEDNLIKAQSDGGTDSKKLEIGNFDVKTIFSEVFYIDTVQTWKEYELNSIESTGNSLPSKDLYISMIGFYWLSQNPELLEKSLEEYTNDAKNVVGTYDIEITIYDDARCLDCQTSVIVDELKKLPFLTGATYNKKDFSEKEVQEFMKANNITMLPAIIFNTNILADQGQITPYLFALNGGRGYSLLLPATFNPFAKRSSNGLLLLEDDTVKNIKAASYIDGNKDATITWIEYSDVQCPYCAKLHNDGTPDTLQEKYGDSLNIVFQHFPLDFHAQAQKGAEALECIAEQNAEVLYPIIAAIYKKYPKQDASVDGITDIAVENGINKDDLASCIDSGKHAEKVAGQMKVGQEVFGITGTPGNIIVNNKTGEYAVISGAYPASAFEAIIDKMLK